MENPPVGPFDPSLLREPMVRRLYRRSVVTGQITLLAVPGIIDEYVGMCDSTLPMWACGSHPNNLVISGRCGGVSWRSATGLTPPTRPAVAWVPTLRPTFGAARHGACARPPTGGGPTSTSSVHADTPSRCRVSRTPDPYRGFRGA
jgi:hypothetical protein